MMASLYTAQWGLVVDGIQIALCVGILFFLVLGRWRTRRLQANAAAHGAAGSFSEEVLLQSVRQRAETALSAIAAAVEAERIELQQLCDTGRTSRRMPPVEASAPAPPFRLGDRGGAGAPMAVQKGYEGIGPLAAGGLDPRQIADRLNLPLGEVELSLKMQRTASETPT